MHRSTDWQTRLRTARRVFGLIPVLVFLLTFVLFAQQLYPTPTPSNIPTLYLFLSVLLRSLAAALTAGVVCIAAYGFYKYLLQRSAGL